MTKRIIFMGSPDFSIPSLQGLIDNFNVVGVITQPDRPSGRGKLLTPPPVKILAGNYDIPILQPEKLNNPGVFETLQSWEPDFIVVVAFGQILRQNVLDLPKHGCINVHGSILPRWRGAAPIQAAILHGDQETGVTIMKMDKGIDTGEIYTIRKIPIEKNDNTETLSNKLSVLGSTLLIETIFKLINGKIDSQKQDDSLAMYAPMIHKEDGLLDLQKNAIALERQIRAYFPWPGAFIDLNGEKIKIFAAEVINSSEFTPGERLVLDGYPVIGTSFGGLKIIKIQPAGRKIINGKEFLFGYKNW
jgi:methionyl-tRNA formyltransferase